MPILLQKVATHVHPECVLDHVTPLPLAKGKIINNESDFSRYIGLAVDQAGEEGAVLVLVDEDEDCAKKLLDSIHKIAAVENCPIPLAIVFSTRCFETWFLFSAASLAGKRNFPRDMCPPEDPETIQNPKGWLEEQNSHNTGRDKKWRYSGPADQPGLTDALAINLARKSASFDKLYREVKRLLDLNDMHESDAPNDA